MREVSSQRPCLLNLRRDLLNAVLDYADTRRLRAYRNLDELDRLFDSILEAAQAVNQEESRLGKHQRGDR